MKSPISNKEMLIQRTKKTFKFRKEEYSIEYHYFLCEESNEKFTSIELDEVNTNQIYNQYRDKHNLPFPEEIKDIREKYELSASKMAKVLGFGINCYRNYENGEVPSQSNGKLIQLISDPTKFRHLVELDELDEKTKNRLIKKVDDLIEKEKNNQFNFELEDYFLGNHLPDIFSGYRKPSIERLAEMIVFFAEHVQPWKTKLNKLLFYADFLHFKKTCYSISGARYRAIDMGPVPNNFNSIFEYVANMDYVDIEFKQFANNSIGEKFKPFSGRKFNYKLFNDRELEVLNLIAKKFKNVRTQKMIDISHRELGWLNNYHNGKKLISYEFGFELNQI
ncbi:MAG: type II TA system antitoxin MqsA family protein [Balneolales bacterium]